MTPETRSSRMATIAWVALAAGGVMAYYRAVWGSLAGFAGAIDHYELFADFIRHYYPMGRRILAFPYPIDGFYYSAAFALLLAPLAALRQPVAVWVWGVFEIALVMALAIVPLRRWLAITGWRLGVYLLLVATSVPVLHNFKWGQVSVLVTLTVLASLHAHGARRNTAAGVWLALGVVIKYYAAWFLIYYILRRQWRVVAVCAAAAVGMLVVVPSIILGPTVTYQFHREAYDNLSAAQALIAQDWNSQFFPHVVLRLLHVVDAPRAVLALSVVGWAIALGTVGVVWILRRRETPDSVALSAAALFLALPFLLSTSWAHYLVYLPFCQAVAWSGLARSTAVRARHELLACVALSGILSSVIALNVWQEWSLYASSSLLFYANVLVMLPVYMLARSSADSSTNEGRAQPVAAE
ncbi:MAG: glycosyltransferase family 87 protein [Acidobacteriota bacterium]